MVWLILQYHQIKEMQKTGMHYAEMQTLNYAARKETSHFYWIISGRIDTD